MKGSNTNVTSGCTREIIRRDDGNVPATRSPRNMASSDRIFRPRRILATPKFQAEVRHRTELKANSFSGRCLTDFDAKDREHLRRLSVGQNFFHTQRSNPPPPPPPPPPNRHFPFTPKRYGVPIC